MEAISYHAISASVDLAAERGRYPSFDGSLWSQGILPIDSIELLADARGGVAMDRGTTLDWEHLRERVKSAGMRNSNVMAIAPTATISNICGVAQSIEPAYQNLYVKSNMSGDFTVVNEFLVRDLKARGLWDEVMVNDLKYFDGSVGAIDRIPDDLKALYATAFEIDSAWLIEAACAAAEMDRPVAVAQPLYRQPQRQEARRALSAGLGARPEDDLLPALAQRDPCREIDAERHRRQAQRVVVTMMSARRSSCDRTAPDLSGAVACSIDNPECEACQ